MEVTVLIENTSDGNLLCEHGLSLYIEHNGKHFLLDAGSTTAFYENAKSLNIALEETDICVLSHGHYDHSGGLEALFLNCPNIKVYAQKSAANPYFSGRGTMHEIGIPKNVLAYKDRFEFVEGNREISEGVYLVAHNTRGLEKIGEKAKLYRQEEDGMVPDDFRHEQSLVFDTKQGLVIFNSCSHGGVSHIIREAREACQNKPVYAYVGGLHMKGKRNGQEMCAFSKEEVEALCNVIKEEKISWLYTGHCTGTVGLEKIRERLGDRVCALRTGLTFIL